MLQSFFRDEPILLVARIVAFLTAIPVHEAAHAYVSDKLGDPTARQLGRLSLNPLRHLDPFGFLAMLTIGIGWAKPVPVNPNYYKDRKVGMAITAAAGPISNLIMAYIAMVVAKIIQYSAAVSAHSNNTASSSIVGGVATVFWLLALININLAFFNLLPIPPFDGSRIFGLLIPDKLYFQVQQFERYVMYIVIALLWIVPTVTGWNPIGNLLSTVNTAVMSGFDWATGYIDMLFLAMLH